MARFTRLCRPTLGASLFLLLAALALDAPPGIPDVLARAGEAVAISPRGFGGGGSPAGSCPGSGRPGRPPSPAWRWPG
jgi:hypothetical protein